MQTADLDKSFTSVGLTYLSGVKIPMISVSQDYMNICKIYAQ